MFMIQSVRYAGSVHDLVERAAEEGRAAAFQLQYACKIFTVIYVAAVFLAVYIC